MELIRSHQVFEREDLAEDLQAKYEAFDKETLAEKTTEAVIAGRLISKRGKRVLLIFKICLAKFKFTFVKMKSEKSLSN